MNKYEVGQKVRVKGNIRIDCRSSHGIRFNDEMDEYKRRILTIRDNNIFGESYRYHIVEDSGEWMWDEEWFEPFNEVESKKDLQDGDIITLANGDRLMYLDGDFRDLSLKHSNSLVDIDDLTDDLTYRYDEFKEKNNVVKVERPDSYYEVFNREETTKELTEEEISKLLGYEVKVVKGH